MESIPLLSVVVDSLQNSRETLTNDLIRFSLLPFCEIQTITSLATTGKYWRNQLNSQRFWKELLQRDFTTLSPESCALILKAAQSYQRGEVTLMRQLKYQGIGGVKLSQIQSLF